MAVAPVSNITTTPIRQFWDRARYLPLPHRHKHFFYELAWTAEATQGCGMVDKGQGWRRVSTKPRQFQIASGACQINSNVKTCLFWFFWVFL